MDRVIADRNRLGVQDALWLDMDRPTNLMVADVVVWTATPLDLDRLRDAITERFVERYPVFASRAVRDDDGPWWEPDPDFDLARHIKAATLTNPDDPTELQALMSSRRVQPLDRRHPLWQVILVEHYRAGSAMVFRSHHAVADGMRMVQLAMSLFDAAPEGGAILAAPAGQRVAERRPSRRTVRELLRAAPGFVDAVRKLVFGPRNHRTVWTGTAGTEKGIAWSDPLPLAQVKTVAKANGCTVNDVLTAAVAVSLNEYLQSREAYCSSVTFMVPVNLKPLDLTMPETLGNEFALTQLELPTDCSDARAVLARVKKRMDRIKTGNEAAIAFRLQAAIARVSNRLYEASVDLFTRRTLGVLTNVPGPPIPVYLAGALVDTIIGWAPVSGEQPMSFSICSYNGQVTVGIAADTGLVPGYHSIARGFAGAFGRIGGL